MTIIEKLGSIVVLCLLGMSAQMLIKKGLTQSGGFDIRHMAAGGLKLLSNPCILTAGVLIVVAFALYLSILSKYQLSFLYPVAVGVNFVLLASGSSLFLNESFSLPKLFGLALILAGISCFFLTKAGV